MFLWFTFNFKSCEFRSLIFIRRLCYSKFVNENVYYAFLYKSNTLLDTKAFSNGFIYLITKQNENVAGGPSFYHCGYLIV